MLHFKSYVFVFSIILSLAAIPVAKHIYNAVEHVAHVAAEQLR